jgi:hypothetical protein
VVPATRINVSPAYIQCRHVAGLQYRRRVGKNRHAIQGVVADRKLTV